MATSNECSSASGEKFFEDRFVTRHETGTGDTQISYEASAGWISLRKIHKPVAHLFHTAYICDSKDAESRPLTFVFNGGPGAASAYLHMGAIGPRRVEFGKEGSLPPGRTQIVDNLESWLAFTDLVFIDPVGTGFSRSLKDDSERAKTGDSKDSSEKKGPEENPEFWEIERDLDSLGEFICRFLSKHHRWTSPLFIAGESYGGFRVAKMAKRLQEKHGVGLCGALLISPAIELASLSGSDYDLTYWIEVFPSLAASAYYHGKTRNLAQDVSLETLIQEAEKFAQNDLSRWLAYGNGISQDEKTQIIKRMSDLCGLEESLIERLTGRIHSSRFCRELLRNERRFCGKYDASIATIDPFPDRSDYEGPDPLWSSDRLFTGAVNQHLRSDLQVETELDYRLLSHEVNKAWKDESGKKHFFRKVAGAMDDLRYGISFNEHMHVFLCHGYFDLITPYFSSGRLINLMKLTEDQRSKIVVKNYKGGHMFYSWDDSRIAFRNDAEEFYQTALS